MVLVSSLDRPIQFFPLEFKYLNANLLPNSHPQTHTENLHFKLKTKVPHPSQPVVSTLGASMVPTTKEPSTPKKVLYEGKLQSSYFHLNSRSILFPFYNPYIAPTISSSHGNNNISFPSSSKSRKARHQY